MEDRTNDTNFASVVALHKNGKILIARRSELKKNRPGEFELIGGHVQYGENFEQALIREIKEEVQLDCDNFQIFDAFTEQQVDGFKAEVCYLCELTENQEPIIDPENHSEMAWISLDEMDNYHIADIEIEVIKKAFKILEGEK